MRAEPFALFVGIAYASLGLLGLLPAALTPPSGYLLDVLPVNGPLSGLHIALGAWGISAWRRLTSPIWFARALAVIATCLAVIGLVPGANTLFGLMPLYGHNIWLHAGTAALAAYFAFHPALAAEHRTSLRSDRRVTVVPVAIERRHGHADRRLPSAGEEI
ncbi:MAG TPA: DUF4383 domain-containing protein [Burkholderiales bacterium]|nr:DUF4383 domain-containing protein [Burkholderiales bacterium]